MFMIRGLGTEAFMNNPIPVRIRKFLGLSDPDPSLFAWIRIWIRILPSSSKNSEKNLDFYSFMTSKVTFYLWRNGNVLSKSNRQKKYYFCWHLEGHWRKKQELDPDPLVRGTDPDPNRNVMDPEHWSEHWFICFPDPLVRGTDERIRVRIRTKGHGSGTLVTLIRTSYRRLLITKEESDRAEARVRMLGGGIVCSDAVLLLAPDCCCCCGYCGCCCCCSCCRCCCCRWAASSCRISREGGAGLEKLPTRWLWPVLP